MHIRTGIGFDVHQLAEGNKLIIGGVNIPHTKGAVGHSDADVLLHAISDALLGAANLRDIGYHFSDKSLEFKGIDSRILLKRVLDLIQEKGYSISNIDTVICLQKPKIAPYIPSMQEEIARVLDIDIDAISVKATTTEHLGFEGREEGVSAFASVLLYKR